MPTKTKSAARIIVTAAASGLMLQYPSASQDIQSQYKNKELCGWEAAQYEAGSKVRYFVAKDGNYYKVGETYDDSSMDPSQKRCNKGEGRIGYIATERRNSCFFGVNVQCLNTLIEIKTQAVLEGKALVEYSTTVGGPFSGTPSRTVLGTLREGFTTKGAGNGKKKSSAKTSQKTNTSTSKRTSEPGSDQALDAKQSDAPKKEKTANACPVYFAYAGAGICRRVVCDDAALSNDPILGGKNWACKGSLFVRPSLAWGSETTKASHDASCPESPPEPGWQSSCKQRDAKK